MEKFLTRDPAETKRRDREAEQLRAEMQAEEDARGVHRWGLRIDHNSAKVFLKDENVAEGYCLE